MSTKGFTLLELMIVLLVSVSTLLMTPFYKPQHPYIEIELFESDVIHQQFIALLSHKRLRLEIVVETSYPIQFNPLGNVLMPQTIHVNDHSLILSLGTGRIYEKSEYLD